MAEITRARVDGQAFILDPGQDVGELKRLIVEAVRHGGGFVQFETIGRSTITALITPHIGVRFELLERSDEQLMEWAENPPSMDPGHDVYDDYY
ncbi:hypothetical protein [Microbacterium sp. ProA8]|uniref:hypothetical protein n=1 Tax=Microbacterium chionoecetis TaxID=3153754 RepID=UPI003264B3C6